MKIFEFIKNDDPLILKLKELIYFDEVWMFPGENVYTYLSTILDKEIPDEFKKISKDIVEELNKRSVAVEDFDVEYENIIKGIFKI